MAEINVTLERKFCTVSSQIKEKIIADLPWI